MTPLLLYILKESVSNYCLLNDFTLKSVLMTTVWYPLTPFSSILMGAQTE